jgi:hypothetical protein
MAGRRDASRHVLLCPLYVGLHECCTDKAALSAAVGLLRRRHIQIPFFKVIF